MSAALRVQQDGPSQVPFVTVATVVPWPPLSHRDFFVLEESSIPYTKNAAYIFMFAFSRRSSSKAGLLHCPDIDFTCELRGHSQVLGFCGLRSCGLNDFQEVVMFNMCSVNVLYTHRHFRLSTFMVMHATAATSLNYFFSVVLGDATSGFAAGMD